MRRIIADSVALESVENNYIKLDDVFRTKLQGIRKDLLIVSQPEGEMFLEDSMRHLSISLDVLGFRSQRDDLYKKNKDYWDLPLWIIAADQEPLEEFCPLDYENRRIENHQRGGKDLPVTWLMPKTQRPSYSNLCWCYSKLIVGNQGLMQCLYIVKSLRRETSI